MNCTGIGEVQNYMANEEITCPECRASVSKEDDFCKKCGAKLGGVSRFAESVEPEVTEAKPVYSRKYSVAQRLYRVMFSPSEVMKDIAFDPDYGGVAVIMVLQFVLSAILISGMLSKFHFTGQYAAMVSGIMSFGIGLAMALMVVLLPVRWLIKSVIVWKTCDSGSKWSFKKAASVTGYAYITDFVLGLISGIIVLSLMPTIHMDTSNLEQALETLQNVYEPQIMSIRQYTLPITFIAISWKSFLGGIGTHFGTNEKCSKLMGITVFFLLALVSFAFSLLMGL